MAKSSRSVYLGLGLALVTVIVAVFDLITDWIAFGDFVHYDGNKMTVAMGIFCGLSTILFIFEVLSGYFQIKYGQRQLRAGYSPEPNTDEDTTTEDPEEARLELLKEALSFLLLILEDFPITVIIYMVFQSGPCPLYIRMFEQSFTAYLSLLGSVVSAVWKLFIAFVYCCQVCCCKYKGVKGVCGHVCCCCCRFLRPLLAIILIGFAGYLYNKYSAGGEPRPDCHDIYSTTVAPVLTT